MRLRSSKTTLAVLSAIFLVLGFWVLIASLIFVDSYALMIGASTGVVVILFTFFFFVTPMMNDNLLTPTKLVIRYGLLIRLEIPLRQIKKVEHLTTDNVGLLSLSRGLRLGIEYSLIDYRYSILRSKRGLVKVFLGDELIVKGWFSQRKLEEIVFDTLDSSAFIERATVSA